MSIEKKLEKALRTKVRFPNPSGNAITLEDLFQLPLLGRNSNALSLDRVGREIKKQLKDVEEESLVVKSSPQNSELQLKLDIIMYVIELKQEEETARKERAENRARRERLESALAHKKDQALENMSAEEIEKQLEALKDND